ncbi:hypothetical protein CP556_24435 [Natrinema sp. CBA1119]|uniref:nucleoside-diphosphate kinase n=1 Tax=Natrinema sp. CBA1119 TaxID=1608465 RepID=UPI000BF303AB|nr:nucleoside-diphosphate kinase [Natrinema sp. CBA1119]PGF14174.1 hypothetical protein CP556_24435 [Natrinema sp. CBA1119]
MNGIIQLVGWLLVALIFIRSFRLSRYLARSDSAILYPGLIASTITAIFVIIVDVIILITGLLTIIAPVLLVVQRLTGYDTSIDLSMPTFRDRTTSDDTGSDHTADPDRRPALNIVGRLWATSHNTCTATTSRTRHRSISSNSRTTTTGKMTSISTAPAPITIDRVIERLETVDAEQEHIKAHYAEHEDKDFYDPLVDYMTDRVIVGIVECENEAERTKQLAGDTETASTAPGTIRGGLADDSYAEADAEGRALRNLIHTAEPADAEEEIILWFGE